MSRESIILDLTRAARYAKQEDDREKQKFGSTDWRLKSRIIPHYLRQNGQEDIGPTWEDFLEAFSEPADSAKPTT